MGREGKERARLSSLVQRPAKKSVGISLWRLETSLEIDAKGLPNRV
jgi:hypothetical protein